MVKRTIACGALSLALLAPCFWRSRIQAGDLSSHVYNAWLAQLIELGQAPGLTLVHQSNNVLFDLMLAGLMRAFGPGAAQRIAVSFAVLVFFWGAFAFVWSCSRLRPRTTPWQLIPCLAMLTYGWVFRMGLFNFYISLGLSLGALALARQNKRWAWAAAIPLVGLAYVAHPLPVAWSLGVLVYGRVAQALAPRNRFRLMAGALGGLALAGFLLGEFFTTRRGPDQFIAMTGTDQVWIYGRAYIGISLALLVVWGIYFQRVLSARGIRRTVLDPRFQLCALGAAALVLLPGGVLLPGYRSALDFLPERMSLAGAVLFCGLVASTPLPKVLVGITAAITLMFFGLSYIDEGVLNRQETQVERVVAQLPPGQRVVSALVDPDSRIRAEVHLIDRACVGKCFSYANYEPCTSQFRVRAQRDNPIVVSNYGDSWDIQTGAYVVKSRDLPMYKVDRCDGVTPGLCVMPLEAGDTVRSGGLRVARSQGAQHHN